MVKVPFVRSWATNPFARAHPEPKATQERSVGNWNVLKIPNVPWVDPVCQTNVWMLVAWLESVVPTLSVRCKFTLHYVLVLVDSLVTPQLDVLQF